MWVKLDDQFWLSDKLERAGWEAVGFHAAVLSYCGQKLNEGHLTARDLNRVGDDWESLVGRLVEAELWDEVDDGWQIHDFLEYNPTAEQVKEDRRKAKERQAQWRARRKAEQDRREREQAESTASDDGHENRNGVTNGVSNGVSHASPTRPDPTRPMTHVGTTPPTPPRGGDGRQRSRRQPAEPANPVQPYKPPNLPAEPAPPPPDLKSALTHRGLRAVPPSEAS